MSSGGGDEDGNDARMQMGHDEFYNDSNDDNGKSERMVTVAVSHHQQQHQQENGTAVSSSSSPLTAMMTTTAAMCRKRSIDDQIKSPTTATTTTTPATSISKNDNHMDNMDDTATTLSVVPTQFRQLRLEAFFHPKFDNEHVGGCGGTGDTATNTVSAIREEILHRLHMLSGGYLEASLKHSGSLLLWSGGSRFYSKNSMNNVFTAAGEIILWQHFIRTCWITTDGDEETRESTTGPVKVVDDPSRHQQRNFVEASHQAAKHAWQRCSCAVQQHRLTCAFELVTSWLGDHGDRPKRDYLILTAIADRSSQRFYSTAEVIAFAQQYQLPHNDVFVFASAASAQVLFQRYDNDWRETGTCDSVVPELHQLADVTIESMYPHGVFQGNILEGLVLRFVPSTSGIDSFQQLAATSRHIAHRIPPSRPMAFDLLAPHHDLGVPLISTTNLRDVAQKNRNLYDLDQPLRKILAAGRLLPSPLASSNNVKAARIVHKIPTKVVPSVPDLVQSIMTSTSSTLDDETRQIAQLMQSLSTNDVAGSSRAVDYPLWHVIDESDDNDDDYDDKHHDNDEQQHPSRERWLCVIHVHQDQTFFKYERYRKQQKPDAPPEVWLYRGFVVELIPEAAAQHDTMDVDVVDPVICMDTNSLKPGDESNRLMIKMKFLPYIVRTFGCRNGLYLIKASATQNDKCDVAAAANDDAVTEAYVRRMRNLMTKWQISVAGQQPWLRFFHAWAYYAKQILTDRQHAQSLIPEANGLPPLTGSCYLDHYDLFESLYQAGRFDDILSSTDATAASPMRGLVVVVALTEQVAVAAADQIAQQLGGLPRVDNLETISSNAFPYLSPTPSKGAISAVAVSTRAGTLRKLAQKYPARIVVVFLGCSDEEACKHAASVQDTTNPKMIMGILKMLKGIHCRSMLELPRSSLYPESSSSMDTSEQGLVRPTEEFLTAIKCVEEMVCTGTNGTAENKSYRAGMLVFFPGIPGCGKTSFSGDPSVQDEIRSMLNGLDGAPRNVQILAGDKMKGKYWPAVQKAIQADPECILIADKNTPSGSTWDTVADVSAAVQAVAVPVLPDEIAMETTMIQGIRKLTSGGDIDPTRVHQYPFSKAYLAVCMARVLSRTAGSHPGKLDSSTNRAGMIVIKFFSLYRNLTAEDFWLVMQSKWSKVDAPLTPTPIRVPFFASSKINLPSDVSAILDEALQAQFGYDLARKKTDGDVDDEYLNNLESRLRGCIIKHQSAILGLAVDESNSKRVFASRLIESLFETERREVTNSHRVIRFVSIAVNADKIHDLVLTFQSEQQLVPFFHNVQQKAGTTNLPLQNTFQGSESKPITGLVLQCHVTLAHMRQVSQKEMRRQFLSLEGQEVEVQVTGLLWSERVAALQVETSQSSATGEWVPMPLNANPHVTIWIQTGASAVESNDLPQLVSVGKASRYDFPEPVTMHGTVSLIQ